MKQSGWKQGLAAAPGVEISLLPKIACLACVCRIAILNRAGIPCPEYRLSAAVDRCIPCGGSGNAGAPCP